MNVEKVHLLVSACINYGHLGCLNLENQELICLFNECLIISEHFGDIFSDIQLYVLLGELKEKMHCLEESSRYFNKMLKVSKRKYYNFVALLAYLSMAIRYSLLYERQKAIEYCNKAINISNDLGIKTIQGHIYEILADTYLKLGRCHETKECSLNCIKISKETRNKQIEGLGYLKLGAAYFGLGKWNEAISSSEECIKIALQLDNMELLGAAYVNIGLVNQNLGNLDQAQKYLERSLKILKDIGDRMGESCCYVNLGIVYQISGKYQEAMKYYQKGLTTSMEINDKDLEGSFYKCLGGLYWVLDKYHKSIQCFEKGLEIFKDIGNRLKEGEIYLHFAQVYNNVGKFQECLEILEKSLVIAIETGNTKNQISCYENIGVTYQNLKKFKEAIGYLVKCLNGAIKVGDKMEEGNAYNLIGGVHLVLGNSEEAIKHFTKSLHIASSINDKIGEGNAYYNLGKAYVCMKKYNKAITYLEKSLNMGLYIGNKRIVGLASHKLGSVYYYLSVIFDEEGDEEKCEDAKEKSAVKLKEALQCWEWQFSHLKNLNDFKISIVDTYIQTYDLLTKVLIERQKTDEALLISDRGRARSLGDILVSRYGVTEERERSQKPLDTTDLENILSSNQLCILFFAIGYEDHDLHAWVLTHQKPICFVNINSQAFTTVKALQLEDGHEKVEKLIDEMTSRVNEFYNIMKETQTRRCENRSFESTDDSGLPNVRKKVQTKKSLIQSVERNVDPVEESQTNVTERKTDHLEVLFSLLVTPVMHNLQQDEIVIIPDGPLYRVPFAALRDPTTGKYLSETKSIRISPSLTTLKALQECIVDHHSKTGALIVGDPDVGDVVLRGTNTYFPPLPSAKREADVIAAVLNAKPLTGSQATKEMVMKKLREGVAVIHIAAHGDSEHGHIALAPPPRTGATSIPEEQDYMLTMQEVQEIGVKAKLVVLSCCHSGHGDIKAEGVVGMSRAFLAAGARAVVASLWALDDEATLSFMVSFYTFLKMGESASKSLQHAMKELKKEGYDEPRYWAPFFLIGDDVTINI